MSSDCKIVSKPTTESSVSSLKINIWVEQRKPHHYARAELSEYFVTRDGPTP